MPVVPDSSSAEPDVLPNLTPVGENTQSDSEPNGRPEGSGELPEDLGSVSDIGDLGFGGLGADGQELEPSPEEQLSERSQNVLINDIKKFLVKEFGSLDEAEETVESRLQDDSFFRDLSDYLYALGWVYPPYLEEQVKNFGGFSNILEEIFRKDSSSVDSNENNSIRGSSMNKKVRLKNGELEVIASENEKLHKAQSDLSNSIRKVKASINTYNDAKIYEAGTKALKSAKKSFKYKKSEEEAKEDVASALKELADSISAAMEVISDLGVDIGPEDMATTDGLLDSAENIMGEGSAILDENADEDFVEEPESGEEEVSIDEISEEDKAAFSKEKTEKKEAKEDKEYSEEESKEDEDSDKSVQEETPINEKSAKEILQAIKSKVAEYKQAAEKSQTGYPYEDKLKQKVDDPGFKKVDIPSEAKKDKLSPKLRGEADAENLKAISKKASEFDPEIEVIDVATSDRIREHHVTAAFNKARVAVELASQQQLKELIDNPLKEALVNELTEYGIDGYDAKALIHNAFIEGFEKAQEVIIKEAFETFINKNIDDFQKVAQFVRNYEVKLAEDAVAQEEATETSKTASDESSLSLKGAPVKGSNKSEYTGYWEDVKARRQAGLS